MLTYAVAFLLGSALAMVWNWLSIRFMRAVTRSNTSRYIGTGKRPDGPAPTKRVHSHKENNGEESH